MTNYIIGRGKVYLDRFLDGTETTTGEVHIGNAPSLKYNTTTGGVDHFSSDQGVNVLDDSAVTQVTRKGTLTCDNVIPDNISLFLFSTTTTVTDAGGTVTGETIASAKPGATYQLGTSAVKPSGIRDLSTTPSDTVVKGSAGTPTYVLGTDYTVDYVRARITILATGSITSGAALKVDYKTVANTRSQVRAGNSPVYGTMRYIAANTTGPNYDYFFPKVKVTPSGDFELKGDTWTTFTFDFEILTNSRGDPAIVVDSQPVASS